MKVLGILVIYDRERQENARQVFLDLLQRCSDTYTFCIVSNNPNLGNFDVQGSNSHAEFSGWEEGVSHHNLNEYEMLVLANDTFCARRKFDTSDIETFSRILKKSGKTHRYFVVGEVCWSINYKRLFYAKKFLLRWVRTSVFAMSSETFHALDGVGINTQTLDKLIYLSSDKKLKYADSIAPLAVERIAAWLFPADNEKGWYGARCSDLSLLRSKAKSVLQEIDLSARCEKLDGTLIPTNVHLKLKERAFNLLYRLQKVLPA